MKEKVAKLIIEDAKVLFMNLEGRKSKFNESGARNFVLVLPSEELALQLMDDGWNVKKKDFENNEEYEYRLDVKVNYDNRPPRIYKITRRGETLLDEEDIEELDDTTYEKIDLIITGSRWEVNGKTGIKAYLAEMNFVMEESPFRGKYNND